MNVQSAFDVVQHKILLDKLLDEEINLILWLVIKDLYSGLSSKIKWFGGLSESFPIQQGVRQGGILSTHLYKIFVQDLLLELEHQSLGFELGDLYIGTPTCADDIAFIETDKDNLQIMLNTISRYADQHHYKIHPKKTKIVKYTNVKDNYKWYLNGKELCDDEDAVHLGLIRAAKAECDKNIESRLESARRTRYALMGSGMHGTNGIDAVTSYNIYSTYVLPRLLYGLEVLPLKKKHITSLENFHRKSLRSFQSLPQRTAISAIYLILGALPVEAELHKRRLSLLYSLLSCENTRITEIINRQIAVNYDNENSYFCTIREILCQYNLPLISQLQNNLPSKYKWKLLINKSIKEYWTKILKIEATHKTTLKFLAIEHLQMGENHPLWNLGLKTRIEVKKAIVKARIITGTLILQIDNQKFSRHDCVTTCQLCKTGDEDLEHFLLICPVLEGVRYKALMTLKTEVTHNTENGTWTKLMNNRENLLKFIIDCRNQSDMLSGNIQLMDRIECVSKDLCYSLYIKRLDYLRT